MNAPENYIDWHSPDLAGIHHDLVKLRNYELGGAGWMDGWMEKMQAAADLVKAADYDMRGDLS